MPRIAQVQKRPQQSMKCESYYPLAIDPAALYTAFKQHLKQHLKTHLFRQSYHKEHQDLKVLYKN